MIGYHATLKMNGLSIIKDKVIKLTNDNNSVYGTGKGIYETSEGYIYLATTIEKALDFGLRAWGRKYFDDTSVEKELYIFEIILRADIEIFIDEDEATLEGLDMVQNKMELINETQAFRIKEVLCIGAENVRYSTIRFKDVCEGYQLIDSHMLNNFIRWNQVN
jgi:hypothetical protein